MKQAFRASVDDYLAFCEERGEEPDKPFSGQFMTRIPPDLHRQVNLAASMAGKSLNAWVAEQLQNAVVRMDGMKAALSVRKNNRTRQPAAKRTGKPKAARRKQPA